MGLADLSVRFAGRLLRSPLMTASGTSGSSDEISALIGYSDVVSSLGAFVTKGVTLAPRDGNRPVRVVEVRTGLLNSVGLENSGANVFLRKELPGLGRLDVPIVVNISAGSVEEFGELAGLLASGDVNRQITGIEVNVSCPNVREGGVLFCMHPQSVAWVVRAVREALDANSRSDIFIVTKLSPSVSDITEPARAAIEGGTHALSMINTVRGMAISVEDRAPVLDNVVGGLSGPAIKPVGLLAVYETFSKVPSCRDGSIPIVGIGGICSASDVLEYIMAGATACGIGTAWLVNPRIFQEVHSGLADFLKRERLKSLDSLVGIAHDIS
jgi:dihydroorotate dehydrogenase (NAD+) catalytic subunit